MVFYKQVLKFHCPSKFLCQTSGCQTHWSLLYFLPLPVINCFNVCCTFSARTEHLDGASSRWIWLSRRNPRICAVVFFGSNPLPSPASTQPVYPCIIHISFWLVLLSVGYSKQDDDSAGADLKERQRKTVTLFQYIYCAMHLLMLKIASPLMLKET
jgi:hypothetical protein